MTDLKITTVNDFDQQGVFPLRTVRVGEKAVRTPAVANQTGKLQQQEDIHPDGRGVNELYTTIGGDDLDAAMRKSEGGKINKELSDDFEKANDDELTITFTKYTEASTLGVAHAQYLAEIHVAYSDIVTVPMMPKIVGNVDPENGLEDPNYRTFKKSVVQFLREVRNHSSEKPIMGLIPKLGWEFIDDLMRIYEDHDVRAYAFDFDRCKVTTGTQISMVRPLMQSIANRGIEERVLFYAINPAPGRVDDTLGVRPAADIASVGMGFDIVGGCHVSPNYFPGIEEGEEEEEDVEITFRLFDRDEWVYREIPVDQLTDIFPEKSGFNPERVAVRTQNSPANDKYRLQHLVNGEQQSLAVAELRQELESGNGYQSIRTKMGVTPRAQDAYQNVRESFDNQRFQSGLGEF